MKVFVWRSYGDVEVYAATTRDQYRSILTDIETLVKEWRVERLNVAIDKAYKALDSSTPLELMPRHVREVLDQIGVGTHESFEQCFLPT